MQGLIDLQIFDLLNWNEMKKQLKSVKKPVETYTETITITAEPLSHEGRSLEELEVMERLFYLGQSKPKKVIDELLAAIEKYPHIPQFYQNLFAIYQRRREYEKFSEWVDKTRERFPDYLFAKCAYAHVQMQNGAFEKVPEIFNKKFSLKSLYPERSVFHFTELMAHAQCMARYFCGMRDFKTAKMYIKMMRPFDPDGESFEELETTILIGERTEKLFASILRNDSKRKSV